MHAKQRRSLRRPDNETDSELKPKAPPPSSVLDIERGIDPRKDTAAGITLGKEVETKKYSYMIVREIAKGRMARVYEVKRSKDSRKLALKVHLSVEPGKPQQLRHEVHIYNELHILTKNVTDKENIRFFDVLDYGESPDGQFLFMTLGGESLASLMSEEKVPDYQSALDISLQMLAAIEQLQSLGFVHCRIRPTAFITGFKSRERYTLYITSFGVARMANPTRPETVLPKTPPQTFDRHAPRAQHIGYTYNRRDDYESWFYIAVDLFHPQFLPWNSEKRLKSMQMADLKEKLMRGDLHFRYSVLPKPFQAIAGAIYETDAKIPNTTFFRDCLIAEAKEKGCTFGLPWDYRPSADLLPVPEQITQTRVEFEFNQCLKATSAFSFGNEKSRTVISESRETIVSDKDGVQIMLPPGTSFGEKASSKVSKKSKEKAKPSKKSNESAKKGKKEAKKESEKKPDKTNASAELTSEAATPISDPVTPEQNAITPQNLPVTPTQSPLNLTEKTLTPTPTSAAEVKSKSSEEEESSAQPAKSTTSEEVSDGVPDDSAEPDLSALSASTATASGLTASASTTTASSVSTETSSVSNASVIPSPVTPPTPTKELHRPSKESLTPAKEIHTPTKGSKDADKCPSSYGTGWISTIPSTKKDKQESVDSSVNITLKDVAIEKTPSCYGTGWAVPPSIATVSKDKTVVKAPVVQASASTTTTISAASTARPPSEKQDEQASAATAFCVAPATTKQAIKIISKKSSKNKKKK